MRCLTCLAVVIAALMVSGCDKGDYVIKERVLGYQGLARKNPYLAAELYLQESGIDASSMTGVVKMDVEEGLVFAPASTLRSTGDAERAIEWVVQGGHFVIFLQRAEDYWKDVGVGADHDPEWWSDEYDEQLGLKHLLEKLDLELVTVTNPPHLDIDLEEATEEGMSAREKTQRGLILPNAEVSRVDTGYDEFELLLGGTQRVKSANGLSYMDDWSDQGEEHSFYSRPYGGGRVTVISDGRVFRNPYLGMKDHAAMLDYLSDESPPGKVVFSLGKVRSFMSMLMEYGWMGVFALLVLLALWLWKNLPNFGPKMDVVTGHFRSYEKQLLATGDFLWTHKKDDSLLNPLRNEVRRRCGAFGHDAIAEETLFENLHSSSGLSLELIQEAMTKTQVHDATTMVRITQNLQTILKSL